jgi:hypothetical protein
MIVLDENQAHTTAHGHTFLAAAPLNPPAIAGRKPASSSACLNL